MNVQYKNGQRLNLYSRPNDKIYPKKNFQGIKPPFPNVSMNNYLKGKSKNSAIVTSAGSMSEFDQMKFSIRQILTEKSFCKIGSLILKSFELKPNV